MLESLTAAVPDDVPVRQRGFVSAWLGVSVALVEKHKMGGDCLNYGCVPSKALIAAARRAHLMRSSAPFGIVPTNPTISYKGVHDHVHRVIASIAPTVTRNDSSPCSSSTWTGEAAGGIPGSYGLGVIARAATLCLPPGWSG